MKPALTAEEWAIVLPEPDFGPDYEANENAASRTNYPNPKPEEEFYVGDRPHAQAAIRLYGQPFGFTRDDVEWLRRMELSLHLGAVGYAAICSIADRIESLLPPESPSVVPVESSSFGEPK